MNRCRFLIDESLPSSLVEGLRRHAPGVYAVQVGEEDAPPKGVSDPEILAFCEEHHLLLITANRATMPDFVYEHLGRQRHTWGVFVIGPDASLSLILEGARDRPRGVGEQGMDRRARISAVLARLAIRIAALPHFPSSISATFSIHVC